MPTYPGSGILTQLCMKDEATYGVAPSLTTGTKFYAPLGGKTLAGKKVPVQGQGIFSGKLHPVASRRVVAGWDAGGTVPLELPSRNLQQWLFHMFGSFGQTPATLTEDGVTSAYSATHAPGPTQTHSFTLQYGVPTVDGTVEPFTYVGCKISEWEISVGKQEIAKFTPTILARNELAGAGNSDPLNASVPALAPYTAPLGGVFHWAQLQVFTGGTATTTSGVTSVTGATLAGNIRSGSIKYTNPLDGDRYFANLAGFRDEPIQNGLRTIATQFEIEWLSAEAMYNAYAGDTPVTFQLGFTGSVIGTGTDHSMLNILIPEQFIDDAPPSVQGPQVVTQTVTMTGLDDQANNPIQATYWTLDTA